MPTINPEYLSSTIEATVGNIAAGIGAEAESRAYRASNELTNAIGFILRGHRNGRIYRVPGTKKTYQASAPGEAPANRTGAFRGSWKRRNYIDGRNGNNRLIHAVTESDYRTGRTHLLGEILENGTGRMQPRPYKQATIDRAMPAVVRIYRAPYGR